MNACWIAADETLIDEVLTIATSVHRELGPGLLESAYSRALSRDLERQGIAHEREREVSLTYRGENLGPAFRADLVIENQLVVELKSLPAVDASQFRQLRTYLTLLRMRTGFLLNFGLPLLRDGIRRVTITPPPPAPEAPPRPQAPEGPLRPPRSPRMCCPPRSPFLSRTDPLARRSPAR